MRLTARSAGGRSVAWLRCRGSSGMQGMRRGTRGGWSRSKCAPAAEVVADERWCAEHRHFVKLDVAPFLRWVSTRVVSSKAGSILSNLKLTVSAPDSNTILPPRAARAAPAHTQAEHASSSTAPPARRGQRVVQAVSTAHDLCGRARKCSADWQRRDVRASAHANEAPSLRRLCERLG